jgi:hypothetical protein
MEEQRLTVRLTRYWESVRKNKPFPQFEHLNTEAIADLWKQCFVTSVVVRESGYQYKYEYMGETVIEAYGRNLAGTVVSHKAGTQFPGAMVAKKMNELIAERRPLEADGQFVNENGKLIKYRACFLPFGEEEKGITHILAGLSYRMF